MIVWIEIGRGGYPFRVCADAIYMIVWIEMHTEEQESENEVIYMVAWIEILLM